MNEENKPASRGSMVRVVIRPDAGNSPNEIGGVIRAGKEFVFSLGGLWPNEAHWVPRPSIAGPHEWGCAEYTRHRERKQIRQLESSPDVRTPIAGPDNNLLTRCAQIKFSGR